MEYSPMMVVMLWALTPSDATSVSARVQEMPTPGMKIHQESYFTFNHGKPFLAEQDPLTGAILNLKTTPVLQDDYAYEEEEAEGDPIDRKDNPKIFTRNDIAQPSKDPDLHKFLNLPVHYSSSGKFPLISSSYANTKVQGHGASAYSNHRLSPTSSTSTVSPSYYSLRTSPSTTTTEGTTPATSSTTTSSTTSTTSTTTTTSTSTTTRPPTTTTTKPPSTTRTTTKPPASYEYEYEYEYDEEKEREPPADKKTTTTPNILDFFGKDYELLGASDEEKNVTKVDYAQPSSTEKPKPTVVTVAPNSNIFIPSDYLKPNTTQRPNKTEQVSYVEKDGAKKDNRTYETVKPVKENRPVKEDRPDIENKHKYQESTTPKSTTHSVPSTTTGYTQTKLIINANAYPPKPVINNETDRFKLHNNEIEKVVQSNESYEAEKLEHGSFGMKINTKDKTETTTKKAETVPPTTKPIEKRPIVFPPTRVPEKSDNSSTKYTPTREENEAKPFHKKPSLKPSDELRPSEVIVPPRPDFHYTYQNSGSRPQDPQQGGHYKPYQRPQYTHPTNVPTEILPPKRPVEPHYQRPQERPYPEIMQYRPVLQKRPQNNRPVEGSMTRPYVYEMQESRPAAEPTSHRPAQPFQPTPAVPQAEQRPQEVPPKSEQRPHDIPLMSEPKPFVTMPPGTSLRPADSISIILNRPQAQPQQQDPTLHTRAPETAQKPIRLPTQSPDKRYPPYLHVSPQESDQKPYFTEYRPKNPRPEQTRPPIVIPDFVDTRKPPVITDNQQDSVSFSKPFQSQFNQPSKVESHFIKVSPGQENPSYSLQTSFSIGVPPSEEAASNENLSKAPGSHGVGQVLFPDEEEKKPSWTFQEQKRPTVHPQPEGDNYPRPPWETHLKPPLAYNHLRKEPFAHKRPKPRPDLPNILPQFRPNAKVGHVEPQIYFKTPLDTLQPPPLPRPQFLRAEPEEEKQPIHRRNGQSPRVTPMPTVHVPKRGALRSEDEKTDPVFVVYPSNNAQDGVVVGTRGPQRPLPPDNLELEDSFPLDANKNFQARVDTPILKGKVTPKPVIKNEFPYPLVKPTELEEKVITTVTKEYTAFSPTVSPTEKEHDTEINVIPYLQDYQPFATKKPLQEPPAWNPGNDSKPISVTLKTQKTEVTTSKIENHKTSSGETPMPQDFQAPFYASLSAPNQGWSVLRPRPDPEKEEETTTAKVVEEQEEKFDIQNFKPQLFGGFKPIIPPNMEPKDPPIEGEKEAL